MEAEIAMIRLLLALDSMPKFLHADTTIARINESYDPLKHGIIFKDEPNCWRRRG